MTFLGWWVHVTRNQWRIVTFQWLVKYYSIWPDKIPWAPGTSTAEVIWNKIAMLPGCHGQLWGAGLPGVICKIWLCRTLGKDGGEESDFYWTVKLQTQPVCAVFSRHIAAWISGLGIFQHNDQFETRTTPQKSNLDTKNCHYLFQTIILGPSMLVFGSVYHV